MSPRLDRFQSLTLAGSLAVVVYTYAGYPLLAAARAALRPRPHRTGPVSGAVTVIIAAHDEASVIVEKLQSLEAAVPDGLDVEVIVVDDGSTDGTAELAEAASERVRVLRLARSGKAAALNAGVRVARGEILVFTDANSMFEPGSLHALLAPFVDPEVGGVAGDQRYVGAAGSSGERAHWSFDRFLKQAESRAGSTVSATGALYALRRAHVDVVPEGVTDDFFLSTGVVADGARLVFAADAVVRERTADSPGREFTRKVRVMTRGLNAVRHRRALLAPDHGFYAVSLISRKVLRRLTAVPLVVAGLTSVLRPRRSGASTAVAAGTWSTALLGAIGLLGPPRLAAHPVFALPGFVCLSVAAALKALWNTATGVRISKWDTPGTTGAGGPR